MARWRRPDQMTAEQLTLKKLQEQQDVGSSKQLGELQKAERHGARS